MNKLNELWGIDTYGLDRMMNGDKDKIFIIEEKEVVSYQHAVVGARTQAEAIEIFQAFGTVEHDEWCEKTNRKLSVWKIDDSHEYHKTFKPSVVQSATFKRCSLSGLDQFWNCDGVVDANENVCPSCLEQIQANANKGDE